MQIFISHVDADKKLASELRADLCDAGFSVWNPDEDTYPGDNWDLEQGKALEESEILIVLLTRNARGSETLLRHVQFALTSTSGNYRGKVVPVAVDLSNYQAGRDVPWILISMKPEHVDTNSGGWKAVVDRVQSLAEKSFHAAE